jgi:hypothetical protein
MRYILMRSKGLPEQIKPCGMNDILGIGEYANPHNALRYMQTNTRHLVDNGYTHLAVYTFPRSYHNECELVLTQRLGS